MQIAKEGAEYRAFPAARPQMSHRATICIFGQFQSFCMRPDSTSKPVPHSCSISSHITGLTHFSPWQESAPGYVSDLSVGERNCYSPETAGETFLQVLQICKGEAPGGTEAEGQAVLCLAVSACSLRCSRDGHSRGTGVWQWPSEVKF